MKQTELFNNIRTGGPGCSTGFREDKRHTTRRANKNTKEGSSENENKNGKEKEESDMSNEELPDNNISSITTGLNRNFDVTLNPNTYHTPLFLYSRYNSKKGITMEFAQFSQKEKQTDTIYPHKEEGGPRHHTLTRPAYINNSCGIGNTNIKLETSYFFRDISHKRCEDREWKKTEYRIFFNTVKIVLVTPLKERANLFERSIITAKNHREISENSQIFEASFRKVSGEATNTTFNATAKIPSAIH